MAFVALIATQELRRTGEMNRYALAIFFAGILSVPVGCGRVQSSDHGVASATRSTVPTASAAATPSQLPGCPQGARPAARSFMAFVYMPALQQAVLFGGRGANGDSADTWTWQSGCWTPTKPQTSPPTRACFPAASAAGTGR